MRLAYMLMEELRALIIPYCHKSNEDQQNTREGAVARRRRTGMLGPMETIRAMSALQLTP